MLHEHCRLGDARLSICDWMGGPARRRPVAGSVKPQRAALNRNELILSLSLYTIGHSTRPISEFIRLLRGSKIEIVADVRSVPRSRNNPQYDSDRLSSCLREYEYKIRALGCARGTSTAKYPHSALRQWPLAEPKLPQLC